MIKLIAATEKHLSQLIPYFIMTGYDLAAAKYNLLGIDPYEYVRDYRIKPVLPITTLAIGHDDDILGMIIGTSAKYLDNYSCKRYPHPKIAKIFKPLIEGEISDSFHISAMSVLKSARRHGVGRALITHAENSARELGHTKLSLYVWNCQTSAIKFYLEMGMIVKSTIVMDQILPFSTILYLEKDLNNMTCEDYFDMTEYTNLRLLEDT